MSSIQIKKQIEKELKSHNFVIFTKLKKDIENQVSNKDIVHEGIQMITKNSDLEMICFFSYKPSAELTIAKFQLATNIENILKQKKKQGIILTQIHLEFLAIFKKENIQFDQIISKIVENNKKLYQSVGKIYRKLTIPPPDAIMKNGHSTNQIKSSQMKIQNEQTKAPQQQYNKKQAKQNKQIKQTKQTKENQNLKNKKLTTKSELIRVKAPESKKQQPKKQALVDQNAKKLLKEKEKQLLAKKLRLQSDSQSEDIYVAQNFMQAFDKKNAQTLKPAPMQIQNQGNYNQNKLVQKMEIQDNKKVENKAILKNTQQLEQSDDQMDDLFNQMDKMQVQRNKNQVAAKSLPQVSKNKSEDFKISQPAKNIVGKQANIAVKQGSLFGWMNKSK